MAGEMIERVALAITGSEQRGGKLTLDDARKYARAAIQAMREPSETMVKTGVKFALDAGSRPWSDYVADMYRHQIDAALQDGEGQA